jgi:hypothetical protein
MIEEILNTKELMRRKYFHVDCDKCVLCDQTSIKEVKHLVFEVKLCRNFLWMLNHEWDVDLLLIEMIADACMRMFKQYYAQIIRRAKPSLKEGIQDWLDLL